ncbi:MAG TPA: hypothetical protein VMR97_02395 [Acidimicrobiales bacterium]|nr:hypothetical protein [Acidimicrobiales bacterium]
MSRHVGVTRRTGGSLGRPGLALVGLLATGIGRAAVRVATQRVRFAHGPHYSAETCEAPVATL